MLLPKYFSGVEGLVTPPIRVQGSKYKLVGFIASRVRWNGAGVYREPFMGTGIVGFNVRPRRAVFSDTNIHIVNLYNEMARDPDFIGRVGDHLFDCKKRLQKDSEFYYEVRDRFNFSHGVMDFVFLSLTCYKGLMRFNGGGGFNSPYQHDDGRSIANVKDVNGEFITNVLKNMREIRAMTERFSWEFAVSDFRASLESSSPSDFVYADPPYIMRNTQYYKGFTEQDMLDLIAWANSTGSHYCVSNWLKDSVKRNPYIEKFNNAAVIPIDYSYFMGHGVAKVYSVTECIVISSGAVNKTFFDKFLHLIP